MSMDDTGKTPSTASSAARNILPAFLQGFSSTKYFNGFGGIHTVGASSSSPSSAACPGNNPPSEAPSAAAPSLQPPTPSTNNFTRCIGPQPLFGRRPYMPRYLPPANKTSGNAPAAAPDSQPVPRSTPSPDIVARGDAQNPSVRVSTSSPNESSQPQSVPRISSSSDSSSNASKTSLPTIHEVEEDVVDVRSAYVATGFCGMLDSPYCVAIAALVALGAFTLGYNQGLDSVTVQTSQLKAHIERIGQPFWHDLIKGMACLGGFFGALLTGWVGNQYPATTSIRVAVVLFMTGTIFQIVGDGYNMLTLAWLIGSVGIGMFSVVVPVYISEISPSEIRGSLLALVQCAIATGAFTVFWVGFGARYLADEGPWRLPFSMQILPAVILVVGTGSLPLSPRWLASQFEIQPTLFVLSQFRRLSPDDAKTQNEWMEIRVETTYLQEINEVRHPSLKRGSRLHKCISETALWSDCFKKPYRKQTHIAIFLMVFQQLSAKTAECYLPPLLTGMGVPQVTQLTLPGVLYGVQLLGAFLGLSVIDVKGRKLLLCCGSALMFFCLVPILAIEACHLSTDWSSTPIAGWSCVVFLSIYMLAFGASWALVPWVVPSEIFPSPLRAKGAALAACSFWLNNFIAGVAMPVFWERSAWGTFLFSGAICILSGVWAFFCVPDTRGRPLEEMYRLFGESGDVLREDERRREIRVTLANAYASEPFTDPDGRPIQGLREV